MLCERESLLTNSTRAPRLTCSIFGLAPEDVIVIVLAAPGGVGFVDDELPPQEARLITRQTGGRRRQKTHRAVTLLILEPFTRQKTQTPEGARLGSDVQVIVPASRVGTERRVASVPQSPRTPRHLAPSGACDPLSDSKDDADRHAGLQAQERCA
jgi:hypothetical protein